MSLRRKLTLKSRKVKAGVFAAAAAASVVAAPVMVAPATAQEVPNGSSWVLGSSSVHPLDAHAMGDRVVPKEKLDAVFKCRVPKAAKNAKKTVLLVHGVGGDSQQSFSWNYIPQLASQGFDVCWVDLPHNGRGDITESAQYVMNGIKLAHARLNKNIGVVGHSAGPPVAMWALRYDPEAAKFVDDFIALAGALHGTVAVEPICAALGSCPAIAWQMHPNSNFVQALHAKPLPKSIAVTSIYSESDYGIQPAKQVSTVAGAANISVQQVCPNHLPGHIGILQNNTAYRLVLDALSNDGPAKPSRLGKFDCRPFFSPGLDVFKAPRLLGGAGEYLAAIGEPRYKTEPRLPSYAQGDVAKLGDPHRIAAGSSERLKDGAQTFGGAVVGSVESGFRKR